MLFEHFLEAAKELWPRCRATEGSLRAPYNALKRFDEMEIKQALHDERAADMDATAPRWSVIIKRLCASPDAPKRNEFQALLHAVRKSVRLTRGAVEASQMSDEDAFREYVQANAYPITHNTITQALRDDPDGKISLSAMAFRKQEYATWAAYLRSKEAGCQEPPEWLEGGHTHGRSLLR